MSVLIEQAGAPRLPWPNVKQYPSLANADMEELVSYLKALVDALHEQFEVQKTDADRLAAPGLSGTKVYYVSDTNGGAVNRKLTFVDGILTAET